METLFWIALAIVGLIGLYFIFRLIIRWTIKPFCIWFQNKRIKHFQDKMIKVKATGNLSKELDEAMQKRLDHLNKELTQLHKF